MKKTQLTERFQQLAGIKSLYTLKEDLSDTPSLKNEMVEFVKMNFEAIKTQFLKQELEVIEDSFSDGEDELRDGSIKFLYNQLKVSTAEELVGVINERSLGVDLDDDTDVINLFNMIRAMVDVAAKPSN